MAHMVLRLKIALACRSKKGLSSQLSDVFARSAYFTLVKLEGCEPREVEVIENPYLSLKHGIGPLICVMLKKEGVEAVVAGDFGPTVKQLLRELDIRPVRVRAGLKVSEAIKEVCSMLQARSSA